MVVSKDNERVTITLPKGFKQELERLAKEDGRTFSSLVFKVLKDYAQKG